MQTRSLGFLIALFIGLIVLFNSLYIVNEFERAVELRLGKVVDEDVPRGLHLKMPFVDTVRKFDGRIMTLDAPTERFFTVEQKSLEVNSFAKWRIVNVKQFYTATNGEIDRARNLLGQRINEELRNQFALRSLQEVVSGQRDELMMVIKQELNRFSATSLGIELVDVRVKRIDLPAELSESVYARMRTERQLEAAEHRASGEKLANILRAEADKAVTVTMAEAYRDAEKLRGEGDAQATEIYATAFSQNAEFFAFVRSLQAYKAAFANKSDLLVVDPDSDFFQYLKDAKAP
jgi:modulator of FtsH protease HflC